MTKRIVLIGKGESQSRFLIKKPLLVEQALASTPRLDGGFRKVRF